MSDPELFPSSRQARVIGLLRPLKDVTVTAGETATFDCELSYEDIPVEWYLKGKKLEPSDQVKGGRLAMSCSSLSLMFSNFTRMFLVLCSYVPSSSFPFLLPTLAWFLLKLKSRFFTSLLDLIFWYFYWNGNKSFKYNKVLVFWGEGKCSLAISTSLFD